ncbi:MAG: hypothetical protein IPN84_14390 [Sphingomonadales bacterium]|jgi:hypothetical protein|nr:hypothetical protein [Sphingomonadales bacterium]
MNKSKRVALALIVSVGLVGSSAVFAAGRLKPAGVAVAVARSGLTVTPDKAWNKGARPGRLSESWTLDGLSINELTFYGGIADNTTLFREVDKTNRPLPRFSKTMLLPDIIQLFESSYRVALTTPLFTVETVEPAPFAGADGFRFTYSFAVADEVKRRGEARGAIIGGKLYMVTYEAPRIHYYDRDYASFVKIAESARIAVVKKK